MLCRPNATDFPTTAGIIAEIEKQQRWHGAAHRTHRTRQPDVEDAAGPSTGEVIEC